MNWLNFISYFFIGGIMTAGIVLLEESGFRVASGFATLIPVFTLIGYLFIGAESGGRAVSQHAKFVLYGTLVSWVPYMIAVIYFSPRLGAHKAIGIGLLIFFVCAGGFIALVQKLGLFV